MKHIHFILLLPLLLLAACGNKSQNPNAVSLSGDIKGLGNDTLYLFGTDQFYQRTDTIVVKDDQFKTTLLPDTMVMAMLQLPNGTEYPLFMDKGEKIKVKGSMAEPHSMEITGNTPNEELTAFRQELKGMAQPSESMVEEKAKSFIESHTSSLSAIYVLEKYLAQKPRPDCDYIKGIIEQMPGELKDRPAISELSSLMNKAEITAEGKNIPFFSIPDGEGKNITRSTFRNKYLLLHFWASWDKKSREANASLRHIYLQEKDNEDFAMLGISLDTNRDAWQQACQNDSLDWQQACDFESWNSDVISRLGIQTLPICLLITPTGRIEARNADSNAILQEWERIKPEKKK